MWRSALKKVLYNKVLRFLFRPAFEIIVMSLASIMIVILISLAFDAKIFDLLNELFRPLKPLMSDNVDLTDVGLLLLKSLPLFLAAFAFTLPYKSGYFNIGAEGVINLCSFLFIFTANFLSIQTTLPSFPILLLSAFCSFIAATLYGALPLVIRYFVNVNEIITGVFLNYISAIVVVGMLNLTNLGDPNAQGVHSVSLQSLFEPLTIWGYSGQAITYFLPLSFIAMALLGFWLWYLHGGVVLRSVGDKKDAAEIMGLKPDKKIMMAVVLGCACASICAWNETATIGKYSSDSLRGLGFEGIIVAILGGYRFTGMFIASIFLTLWRTYDIGLQNMDLPSETILFAQALFMIGYLIKEKLFLFKFKQSKME